MDNNNPFENPQITPTENMVVGDVPPEVPGADTVQTGANPIQNTGFNHPQQNPTQFQNAGGFNQQQLFGVNPNMGGGFQQNSFQQPIGGGFQQNNQQPKYVIFDLFWLLNPKIESSQNLQQNEAQFVSISYNIQYGNLKITFSMIPQGAINGHVVFYNKLQRVTTGTIYPSGSNRVIYSNPGDRFVCMEQLFQETGESWQSQRPRCEIEILENNIKLSILDPHIGGTMFYEFEGWQKQTFIDSCKFAIGKGLQLSGQYRIKRYNTK